MAFGSGVLDPDAPSSVTPCVLCRVCLVGDRLELPVVEIQEHIRLVGRGCARERSRPYLRGGVESLTLYAVLE